MRQEHGDWPQTVALSAWGTSNMRTGGDDIAQALALIGARPTWDSASRRVTGFEVLPVSVLDRPRVDVTLRVSGFFRDAFPGLIDLFDSAVAAIAAIDDESEADNPLAARVATETAQLVADGAAADAARRTASFRVFGSQARGLWRRSASPDRRTGLGHDRGSGQCLYRLGRLGLRGRAREPALPMPMAHQPIAPSQHACQGSKPFSTIRTTGSTICSTAMITTSSKGASPQRWKLNPGHTADRLSQRSFPALRTADTNTGR